MSIFESGSDHLTFWEHVEEFRQILLKSLSVFICFFFLCFFFNAEMIQWITSSLPLNNDHDKIVNPTDYAMLYTTEENYFVNSSQEAKQLSSRSWIIYPKGVLETTYQPSLILLNPYEGLLATLKVAFWASLTISSPFCIFFILQFLFPALYEKEKKLVIPILIFGYLFGALGIFFALKISLPISNKYLWELNNSLGKNMWSLPAYLDYVFIVLHAHALSFIAMSTLIILIHYNFISGAFLALYRRHFIISALIASALLTPPDIFSQIYLTAILIFFYELAILYGNLTIYRDIN